jgi:hypothetical protein
MAGYLLCGCGCSADRALAWNRRTRTFRIARSANRDALASRDGGSCGLQATESSSGENRALAPGLLFAAERRPGPKGELFVGSKFRGLKAPAPSDSLTLKHQEMRFALWRTDIIGLTNEGFKHYLKVSIRQENESARPAATKLAAFPKIHAERRAFIDCTMPTKRIPSFREVGIETRPRKTAAGSSAIRLSSPR